MLKFWGIFSLLLLAALPLKAQEVLAVSEDEIAAAVKKEFTEQGLDDNIEVEFFGGQSSFAIENAKVAKILISGLKTDAAQNKFSATAEIYADGRPYAKTQLSGKFFIMGEVWVPAQTIEKDKVITEEMLKTIPMRSNRIKSMYVVEKEKLVDMQAKKTLKEGKIVNDRDIGKVILIKKGQSVTSVYRTDNMQITAKVVALEEGSRGDKIQVMNTKSSKKFYAEVVDADTVAIDAE